MSAGELVRRTLPGVWLGALLSLSLCVAPTLFAGLDRPLAGKIAARLFMIDAQLALAMCVVLGVLERQRAARQAASGAGSRVSTELLIVLGALFCTVLGHYALLPMMEAARAGTATVSFGVLHAVSTVFFGLKTVLVAWLAARAVRPG